MSISEDEIRGQTKSIQCNFVQYFNKCFSISLYNHSVDNRYLYNGGENVGEGNEDKIVESCGIRNFGQILPGLQPEEGHREDSGDSCNNHRLSHNYNHTPCCCRTSQYLLYVWEIYLSEFKAPDNPPVSCCCSGADSAAICADITAGVCCHHTITTESN